MGWEVVTIGIDENLDEYEETYTTCKDEAEADRIVALLRRSMLPFVILVREYDDA